MSNPQRDHRAEPDSLVALVPVHWDETQLSILSEVHPGVWAEALETDLDDPAAPALLRLDDGEATVSLQIDEALPELAEMTGMAKQPFRPSEIAQLQQHSAIWRLTMADVSSAPVDRAHAFSRLLTTCVEAGAPAVFLPFCIQLHSPSLIKHLAVDFSQPPAMINLFVNAWNDDQWMITRGLTVFGLPELETPIEGGLNDAYFRLMDVAAALLAKGQPYPEESRLQLGPHLYVTEKGPQGPEDKMVPICGVYGRTALIRDKAPD